MLLKEKELLSIRGGAFNASLVSAIIKGFQFIYDIGRVVGTTIRRAISKDLC